MQEGKDRLETSAHSTVTKTVLEKLEILSAGHAKPQLQTERYLH